MKSFAAKRTGRGTHKSSSAVRLLEHGITPPELQCFLCASEFSRPRSSGCRFDSSLQFACGVRNKGETEGRLFVGNTVTLACVNRSLSDELGNTSVYFGEPVIVGSLESGAQTSGLALFCEDCGLNIASHANDTSRSQYAVDRLVELVPARLAWKSHRRETAQGSLLADSRVRAYFFARQILARGGCSRREMCIRALRTEIPLAEVEVALMAMGASYGFGEDGELRVDPGESPFFGETRQDPFAAEAAQHAPRDASAVDAGIAGDAPGEVGPGRHSILNGRREPLRPGRDALGDAWRTFFSDPNLRRTYNITPDEIYSLASASLMGGIESKRDLLFMLDVLRSAK